MAFCNCPQNLQTNRESLSETIDNGALYRQTISLIYNLANFSKLAPSQNGKKWADLDKRSTITQIALLPLVVLGSPTAKSIVMCSQFHSGIGRGYKGLEGFLCSTLTCWQVWHFATNLAISFFILCHKKWSHRSLDILVPLGCTV